MIDRRTAMKLAGSVFFPAAATGNDAIALLSQPQFSPELWKVAEFDKRTDILYFCYARNTSNQLLEPGQAVYWSDGGVQP